MVTINKLAFDDLMGLKLLYEDAFVGSLTNYTRMTEVYNEINNLSTHIILVARKDNKIVGSVMGVVCNELFGECLPFMVVENVAVLNAYRRLGIAKQLMTELEKQSKIKNCTAILFVSSAHRTGAHKLYESLGYGLDKVNGYRKRLK